MKQKMRILFLCTGNACRSQMAEGWARHLRGDFIEPYSGGIRPAGVSSRAAAVMKEAGVDISHQYSKHVSELLDIDFDYVVTVCDNAREMCPVFPGKARMVHKSFPDPAAATGTAEEIISEFRKVRDEIRDYILTLPQSLEKECDQ
jgi:arsenate reductase